MKFFNKIVNQYQRSMGNREKDLRNIIDYENNDVEKGRNKQWQFAEALLLTYFGVFLVLQLMRIYKIVPRWQELGRMPNAHDGIRNSIKVFFFSPFWDEFILALSHIFLPVVFAAVTGVYLIYRKKGLEDVWLLWIFISIVFEIIFRSLDAYGFVMSD